jgi:hypothetical protein
VGLGLSGLIVAADQEDRMCRVILLLEDLVGVFTIIL